MISIGDKVGDYTLVRKIGEGGFGEVYLAEQGLDQVAIKISKDPSSVGQFKRFLKVQSHLKSPNVVSIIDSDLAADPAYIVMELVDGCTLRDIINRLVETGAGVWSYRRPAMLYILKEVAAALRDAHQQGISHLDLKPSNILVSTTGEVKLTDFEFSKTAKDIHLSISLASVDSLAGTLAYMSPEQRVGRDIDARSDIYTFGVIMFEALTGETPQPGDVPSDFIENDAYDKIFSRCFARLTKRYTSGKALYAIFDKFNKDLVNRSQLVGLLQDFRIESEQGTSNVSNELVSNVFPPLVDRKPTPKPGFDPALDTEPYRLELFRVDRAANVLASLEKYVTPIGIPDIIADADAKYGPGNYRIIVQNAYGVPLNKKSFTIADKSPARAVLWVDQGWWFTKQLKVYKPLRTMQEITKDAEKSFGLGRYLVEIQTASGQVLKTKKFEVRPKPKPKPKPKPESLKVASEETSSVSRSRQEAEKLSDMQTAFAFLGLLAPMLIPIVVALLSYIFSS